MNGLGTRKTVTLGKSRVRKIGAGVPSTARHVDFFSYIPGTLTLPIKCFGADSHAG